MIISYVSFSLEQYCQYYWQWSPDGEDGDHDGDRGIQSYLGAGVCGGRIGQGLQVVKVRMADKEESPDLVRVRRRAFSIGLSEC